VIKKKENRKHDLNRIDFLPKTFLFDLTSN